MKHKIILLNKDGKVDTFKCKRTPTGFYDYKDKCTPTDEIRGNNGKTEVDKDKITYKLVGKRLKGFWIWKYQEAYYMQD